MPRADLGRRGCWVLLAALCALGTAAPSWSAERAAAEGFPVATPDAAEPAAEQLAPVRPSPISPLAPAPPKPAVTPPAPPTPRPSDLASLFAGTGQWPSFDRLAGTPNMFGDGFQPGGRLLFNPQAPLNTARLDLPLAGASRRAKIAENNSPLVQDRVYFLYNHFQDALEEDAGQFAPGPVRRAFSVDRYTLGFEKSLWCGLWSVEMRMPLAGSTEFATEGLGIAGGNTGNLAVIVKRRLFRSQTAAAAIGLGIDTPTGSDVDGRVLTTGFVMRNEAVHLVPYFALLGSPGQCFFYQGFLEVDIPANGNRIDYHDAQYGAGTFGRLNEQTLLYLDLAAGYWLYRNRCASGLTGLASLVELHYTTTLQDAHSLEGRSGDALFRFVSGPTRADIVNLTVGLHAELANRTLCRVGAVFPLGWGDNRAFDAEVQVQVERRF